MLHLPSSGLFGDKRNVCCEARHFVKDLKSHLPFPFDSLALNRNILGLEASINEAERLQTSFKPLQTTLETKDFEKAWTSAVQRQAESKLQTFVRLTDFVSPVASSSSSCMLLNYEKGQGWFGLDENKWPHMILMTAVSPLLARGPTPSFIPAFKHVTKEITLPDRGKLFYKLEHSKPGHLTVLVDALFNGKEFGSHTQKVSPDTLAFRAAVKEVKKEAMQLGAKKFLLKAVVINAELSSNLNKKFMRVVQENHWTTWFVDLDKKRKMPPIPPRLLKGLGLTSIAGTGYAVVLSTKAVVESDHPWWELSHQLSVFLAATKGAVVAGSAAATPCASAGIATGPAGIIVTPVCIGAAAVTGGTLSAVSADWVFEQLQGLFE